MPWDYLQVLYCLLHFVDDYEIDDGENWNEIYSHVKVEGEEGTASHRTKIGLFEDAYIDGWWIQIGWLVSF